MVAKIINKDINQILVVGPIYDKINKYLNIEKLIHNYDYVIINGGLNHPSFKLIDIKNKIEIIDKLINTGKVIYNLDCNDLLLAYNLYYSKEYDDVLNWIWRQPNIVLVYWKRNQTATIITAGGVSPKMNREYLLDDLETSFISKINGKNWHEIYGGMYGYIISNNPLTSKAPEFYKFSAQIGNKLDDNTEVYCQEVNGLGLKSTILL